MPDMTSVTQQSCSCRSESARSTTTRSVAAAIMSVIGLCTACCVVPLAFAGLGVAGAWAATLDELSRYKGYLIAATVAVLGYASYSMWRRRRCRCAEA